jgi:hypothetical protein
MLKVSWRILHQENITTSRRLKGSFDRRLAFDFSEGDRRRVFLPPYGPELNPIERVWRDLKDAPAWLQFPTLDVPQDDIAHLLRGYEVATLQALTGYASLIEAIHVLCA